MLVFITFTDRKLEGLVHWHWSSEGGTDLCWI